MKRGVKRKVEKVLKTKKEKKLSKSWKQQEKLGKKNINNNNTKICWKFWKKSKGYFIQKNILPQNCEKITRYVIMDSVLF